MAPGTPYPGAQLVCPRHCFLPPLSQAGNMHAPTLREQGENIHWFSCLRFHGQGNQICSCPVESIFKFPARREQI